MRHKTHDEMRASVCVNCLAPGCTRKVSPGQMTDQIRQYVVGDFGPDVESLPVGICEGCRKRLSRNGKLECSVNYTLLRKRGTFKCYPGQENFCQCYICVKGRDTLFKAKPKGAPKPPPITFTTCAKCFAKLQPGHPHDCRVGARVDNVLSSLPPDVAQQIASKVVSNEAGDSPSTSLMRPKGPRMTVTVGKVPEKPSPLSHQDLLHFKVKYRVSNRDTLAFAHDYRAKHGRDSVESFLGDFLVQQTDIEASFLEITTIKINSGGELIEKVCVIVSDLQSVIDHIKEARHINEEVCLVKIMGDTGGSFFKMSLATINLDRLRRLLAEGKARKTYADGPFIVDDNDNGINALFIVAIVPKCTEDYLLVSQVIKLLKLQNLRERRWISGGDQKYVNLICGVGEHSSTYPCSWCDLPAIAFRARQEYELRTFGGIRSCNAAREAAGPRAEPRDHLSIKHEPALPCKDEEKVIERVVPPELHFLLRAFNHLWKCLGKAWKLADPATEDPATKFAIDVNAVPSSYHGQDFKGDACRRLLKSLDRLTMEAPPVLAPYIKCLADLNAVVISCFSVAGPEGTQYMDDLEAFYESASALLDVSFTPTLHGIVEHIKDFFEIFGTEFGLGLYGEQAGESVHYDFENRIYTNAYKRPQSHPEFGPMLLRAVAHYNAIHLNALSRATPTD